MGNLKKALKKLDEQVKDLTSLHVQTFTGDLTVTIDDSKGYQDIKTAINAAIAAEKKKTSASAKFQLVAETLAQFDGDSYNFVNKDLDDVPQIALEVHKNAVKAGIETRLGLLNLFKDIIS